MEGHSKQGMTSTHSTCTEEPVCALRKPVDRQFATVGIHQQNCLFYSLKALKIWKVQLATIEKYINLLCRVIKYCT